MVVVSLLLLVVVDRYGRRLNQGDKWVCKVLIKPCVVCNYEFVSGLL